jgi:uncharacterized membrane protein YedE/YeeE
MNQILTFLAGLVFAVGLGVSGMTDAGKVIGFLDVSGGWDPSLALVMIAAIGVHLPLYRLITRRPAPVFAPRFEVPARTEITGRLVLGSALFGAGWALSGFCPGPAIVSAAALRGTAVGFVAAMTVGMFVWERWAGRE